jgi:hypothetical protein
MAEQIRVGDVLRLKAKSFRELLGDTATVTRVHTQIRHAARGAGRRPRRRGRGPYWGQRDDGSVDHQRRADVGRAGPIGSASEGRVSMLYWLVLGALVGDVPAIADLEVPQQFIEACRGQFGADDFVHSMNQSSCMSYVAGYMDGVRVTSEFTEKVTGKKNPWSCLPKDGKSNQEWFEIVAGFYDRLPKGKRSGVRTRLLFGAALQDAFPSTPGVPCAP